MKKLLVVSDGTNGAKKQAISLAFGLNERRGFRYNVVVDEELRVCKYVNDGIQCGNVFWWIGNALHVLYLRVVSLLLLYKKCDGRKECEYKGLGLGRKLKKKEIDEIDIVIGCGRTTAPAVAALKLLSDGRIVTVQILHPRTIFSDHLFSFIFTPLHDCHHDDQNIIINNNSMKHFHDNTIVYDNKNTYYTLGAPSFVDLESEDVKNDLVYLHKLRDKYRLHWGNINNNNNNSINAIKIGVLIGGPTRHCDYTDDDVCSQLISIHNALLKNNHYSTAHFYITVSRRTPKSLISKLHQLTSFQSSIINHEDNTIINNHNHNDFWIPTYDDNNSNFNPYQSIISECDCIAITADSISMISEILSCGKPLHILLSHKIHPNSKHSRFHEQLSHKSNILSDITRNIIHTYSPINNIQTAVEVIVEASTRKEEKMASYLTGTVALISAWAFYTYAYTKIYKIPGVWPFLLHCFNGMLFSEFIQMLIDNRFMVHPIYWHRLAYLFLKTAITSYQNTIEMQNWGEKIEKVQIKKQPLFVLGHWRSGTTLLHNLLSEDTDQFAFPNTFQCINPNTFLEYEEKQQKFTRFFIPDKRPMDNMKLSLQSAQEDEFAIASLCTISPQTGDCFMSNIDYYYKFLTFRGVAPNLVNRWKEAFLFFLKKLTVKYPEKRLLLKSPHHTARIKIILEMFPDAKFVTITRNPYTVYQSTLHLMNTLYPQNYLQVPPLADFPNIAIDRYVEMCDAYFEQKNLIPEGNLIEIKYEELAKTPLPFIEDVYKKLNLPGFQEFRPKLEKYISTLNNYEKNKHGDIPVAIRNKIAKDAKASFDNWGYSTQIEA